MITGKACKVMGITFIFWILLVCINLPDEITLLVGGEQPLNLPAIITVDNGKRSLHPLTEGIQPIQYKLLNVLPFKSATVKAVATDELIIGGKSIGIKLRTKGVLVVDVTDIPGGEEIKSPAKQAGIMPGDRILSIDGQEVYNIAQFCDILSDKGAETVKLEIDRGGQISTHMVEPAKYKSSEQYKLGIWARDSASGIGTMTYINPSDNSFGALGHGISDNDTGVLLDCRSGEIVDLEITDRVRGEKGVPGELRGRFLSDKILGQITGNRSEGIYGYTDDKGNGKLVKVGSRANVKLGKASIFADIDSGKIEEYEVQILKVSKQNHRTPKSMVVQVTDARLLEATGGIVQGMSGSPLVQDEQIIGAITHVFVNDPTKGYAIFIEWMLE